MRTTSSQSSSPTRSSSTSQTSQSASVSTKMTEKSDYNVSRSSKKFEQDEVEKKQEAQKLYIEKKQVSGLPTSFTTGLGPGVSSKNIALAVGGRNPLASRSSVSKEEADKARADRKEAEKARKQDAKITRNEDPSFQRKIYTKEWKESIQREDAQIDRAERTLSKLPNSERSTISDGKIWSYGLNSTHREGASKAKALAALGFKTYPGGAPRPFTKEAYGSGEQLRQQIQDGAQNSKAVLTNKSAKEIKDWGMFYTTHQTVNGVNEKQGKSQSSTIGWVDKRQADGTTLGRPELTTMIIGKEEKK